MRWLALVGLVACGGTVGSVEDAGQDVGHEASHEDVQDAQEEPRPDAGPDAPSCVCGATRLVCDGVPATDALSCATCGYPCDSNDAAK